MEFTKDERRWIKLKWVEIRKAQKLADSANNSWNAINDAVNDWLKRSGETDPVQIAKIKSENLALRDAIATGDWHSRNAERHIHDLNMFLRLRELEIL